MSHEHGRGGTTEEGNCSYLLSRAAAAGANGTNKGQIRKVPVDEIARFLVYRMNVTRCQLSANTGILVRLVREICKFSWEGGNSTSWRSNFAKGRRWLIFITNYSICIWQTDRTKRKERSHCEMVNWKYVSWCDEQMKTTCLIRPRGNGRNTIGAEWWRFKHI